MTTKQQDERHIRRARAPRTACALRAQAEQGMAKAAACVLSENVEHQKSRHERNGPRDVRRSEEAEKLAMPARHGAAAAAAYEP